MKLLSNKAVRLLLAVSVSVWMAGGCMFGCSSTAIGAEVSEAQPNAVEAGESCHAKRSVTTNSQQQLAGVPFFVPSPRGAMKDCPLVVNSTAVTSKSSAHVPGPARGPIAALPGFEKQIEHAKNTIVVQFLPNRGPTHLRCCVFLI